MSELDGVGKCRGGGKQNGLTGRGNGRNRKGMRQGSKGPGWARRR